MSPGFPPGPLERNIIPLAVGIVAGLFATLELRRHGKSNQWLKGIGFGLVAVVVSVFNLPLGVFSGVVVYLLVRR